MSTMKHVRSRHPKSTSSDLLLTTDEPHNHDIRRKHDRTQIVLMICTALVYLLHTLRMYIPETNSRFWIKLAHRPITRVYSSDLRPSMVIESLLFRLAENWQTFWLLYTLSYIPRRKNVLNSSLCYLLITALGFQTISQSSFSPEISCLCLYTSLVLLIITCRNIAVKFYSRSMQSFKPVDLIIQRYFVLNSLFLYTTMIAYSCMCATVEYLGIYLDPDAIQTKTISTCTTIGLMMIFFLLLIYFLFDRLVYDKEFSSIWTPYLFIAYAFICPPLRSLSFLENDNHFNSYLFWFLFCFTLSIMSIRFFRQCYSFLLFFFVKDKHNIKKK